jgi:hypothetical protein
MTAESAQTFFEIKEDDFFKKFITQDNSNYDLAGTFFYGHLLHKEYHGGFFLAMQKIKQEKGVIKYNFIPCVVGYNDTKLGKYVTGAFPGLDFTYKVISDPWEIRADFFDQFIQCKLISGTLGEKGCKIMLKFSVKSDNKPFSGEVILEDVEGLSYQGYGRNSFYPQWLYDEQYDLVKKNGIEKYCKKYKDNLRNQGTYYFTQNNLQVLSYNILIDEEKKSGAKGIMWCDYLCASYDTRARAVLDNVSWNFFVLQFDNGSSMTVGRILVKALKEFKTANYYKKGGGQPYKTFLLDDIKINDMGDYKYKITIKGTEFLLVPQISNQNTLGQYEGIALIFYKNNRIGYGWIEVK